MKLQRPVGLDYLGIAYVPLSTWQRVGFYSRQAKYKFRCTPADLN